MSWSARQTTVHTPDGLQLAAYEGGNPAGPPVLFIHGYLFSAEAFAAQFAGPLAASCRLIAFDLRGHGASDKPLDRAFYASANQWAADVTAVLDAFAVSRATMVGWSLGSRVVLNYAWICGFNRISALNLVAATLPTASHDDSAGLSPTLAGLLSPDAAQRAETTRHFLDLCTVPGPVAADNMARWFELAMSVPPLARIGTRSWRLPYDDNLTWIACRTLVTHGAEDPVVPLDLSRREADAIPGGQLQVILGAGHMPFADDPAQFDAALMRLARTAA